MDIPIQSAAALKPGHLKVLMDISNKCNLRCTMCHFSFDKVFYRPANYMSLADFDRIAQKVLPFAHTLVLSAGSEPTTSPHFADILHSAGQWQLSELKFLTNATLMTEKLCVSILDSGVTQVDVSIDGATRDTYETIRRGAKFDRLKKNLQTLRDLKKQRNQSLPLVQFNITLMKSNLAELEMFVDLAEELGVERIGCRHLMPYEGLNISSESLFDIPMEANLGFQRFVTRIEQSKVVQLITFPDFFPTPATETDAKCSSIGMLEAQLNRPFRRVLQIFGSPPLGYLDIPVASTVMMNETVSLAGWALDEEGATNVVVASRATKGSAWKIHQVAKRVNGSRPDVAEKFPNMPKNSSAGWVCDLDTTTFSNANVGSSTSIEVFALNGRGFATWLGARHMTHKRKEVPSTSTDSQDPFLFCRKPFNSTYIDVNGDVYPYADCRPDRPSGNLLTESSFVEVWNGHEQSKLRQAICEGKPPAMCSTCPNFINRNTNKEAYFADRHVVERYVDISRLTRVTTQQQKDNSANPVESGTRQELLGRS